MSKVRTSHIRWREPITIKFGFTGIDAAEAALLVRKRFKEDFPDLDRPGQCVYVVRLKGSVAVAYKSNFTPAIYIGAGNAASRLYNHANWIAELLVAVPNADIEVRVADCVRKNDVDLYRYVEADLIAAFIDKFECLPWFNRQRERSYEGQREYDAEVLKDFRARIGRVKGSKYLWAIQPTSNNAQYDHYKAGLGV